MNNLSSLRAAIITTLDDRLFMRSISINQKSIEARGKCLFFLSNTFLRF
jgi:hypothetical protein